METFPGKTGGGARRRARGCTLGNQSPLATGRDKPRRGTGPSQLPDARGWGAAGPTYGGVCRRTAGRNRRGETT
eukprot:555274-Lingulodinium_polyedra.AAC.1